VEETFSAGILDLKDLLLFLVDCTSEIALSDLKSTMIEVDTENFSQDENLIEIFKYFDIPELNFGLMLYNKKEQKLEKMPVYENIFTNHVLNFWINSIDEDTKKHHQSAL
jgi:hypothetical protein